MTKWIPGSIADRLALARNAIGMSQANFCSEAGIEPPTYKRWESGQDVPPGKLAIALVDRWDLTLD